MIVPILPRAIRGLRASFTAHWKRTRVQRSNGWLITALLAAILLALLALPSLASAQGGTIAGVVRDSAARPIAGADITIRPGEHRTRSDSAGRFLVAGLGADHYAVRARKIGYAPTHFDVSLSSAGRADILLVFDERMPMLDTITVTAGRICSSYTLDGFVCRRRANVGVFLDYTDIDDMEALFTADLFRQMKGLHVGVRSTRAGPARVVEASPSYGCIASLVDGREPNAATPIPQFPYELIGLEVYTRPDQVPAEYQRYTWPEGGLNRSGRCTVIIYWTVRARMTP